MKSALLSAFFTRACLVIFCSALTLLCNASCVRLPRKYAAASTLETQSAELNAARIGATPLVNINRATRDELERLPGVGPSLAGEIIAHRERHGAFRRVEHLLAVRGISQRRFAELRAHVTAE